MTASTNEGAPVFLDLENVRMLVVQDRAAFISDSRKNLPWITTAIGLIIFWLFASAGVSALGDLPYVTPGYVPVPGQVVTFFGKVQGQDLHYATALYATAINMTTVGFGDIYPLSGAGRLLAVLNAVVGLTLFAMLTAILVMALQPATSSGPELRSLDPEILSAAVESGFRSAAKQLSDQTQASSRLIVEAKKLAESLELASVEEEAHQQDGGTRDRLIKKLDEAETIIESMSPTLLKGFLQTTLGSSILPKGRSNKL